MMSEWLEFVTSCWLNRIYGPSNCLCKWVSHLLGNFVLFGPELTVVASRAKICRSKETHFICCMADDGFSCELISLKMFVLAPSYVQLNCSYMETYPTWSGQECWRPIGMKSHDLASVRGLHVAWPAQIWFRCPRSFFARVMDWLAKNLLVFTNVQLSWPLSRSREDKWPRQHSPCPTWLEFPWGSNTNAVPTQKHRIQDAQCSAVFYSVTTLMHEKRPSASSLRLHLSWGSFSDDSLQAIVS